jgi:uncharacterized protein (UPF0333 family)
MIYLTAGQFYKAAKWLIHETVAISKRISEALKPHKKDKLTNLTSIIHLSIIINHSE